MHDCKRPVKLLAFSFSGMKLMLEIYKLTVVLEDCTAIAGSETRLLGSVSRGPYGYVTTAYWMFFVATYPNSSEFLQ